MNKVQSEHHGSGTFQNEHGNPKQSQIETTADGRKYQREGDEKYLGMFFTNWFQSSLLNPFFVTLFCWTFTMDNGRLLILPITDHQSIDS